MPSHGRFIASMDLRRAARVCVLGSEIKRELFGVDDAIGKSIKIGEEQLRGRRRHGRRRTYKDKQDQRHQDAQHQSRRLHPDDDRALKRFTDADYPDRVEEIAVQVDERRDRRARPRCVIQRILDRTHYGVAGLRSPDPGRTAGAEPAHAAHLQHRHGLDRGAVAARRRHRHHEHHAGERHRAHQGDRHPPGAGRLRARHHGPVPERDRAHRGQRRPHRHRARRR